MSPLLFAKLDIFLNLTHDFLFISSCAASGWVEPLGEGDYDDGASLFRARCTNLKKFCPSSDAIEEALHLRCEQGEEKKKKKKKLSINIFLGEGGKGERVTCASSSRSVCRSLGAHRRAHLPSFT